MTPNSSLYYCLCDAPWVSTGDLSTQTNADCEIHLLATQIMWGIESAAAFSLFASCLLVCSVQIARKRQSLLSQSSAMQHKSRLVRALPVNALLELIR